MELMRGLAFVALLFAGSAVGAELRQAEVCTDGTTHQLGYCPAVLSSASCSATGATTGSCSATSDEADGTRYVCATSNTTALTGAEIEACSGGAAVAGASAAETGSNSVSLSGLTTDAAHYGQIVNESPEGWYSNRLVSSSFTPAAAVTSCISASELADIDWHNGSGAWGAQDTISCATLPTTTSSTSCSTFSECNSAVDVDGAEVTITSGWSQSNILTVSGNDVDIIINSGVTIGAIQFGSFGCVSPTVDRVRVRGETVGSFSGGTMGQIRAENCVSDLTIDGIAMNGAAGYGGGETNQCFRFGDVARVSVIQTQCRSGGYGWLGTATDVVINGLSMSAGAATTTSVGFNEGWGIRNAAGPFTVINSDIRTTRYVPIRTHSTVNGGGAGELLYIGNSKIVSLAEGRSMWWWPDAAGGSSGPGLGATLENSEIYGYSDGDCGFGAQIDIRSSYSRIDTNAFYSLGSTTFSQAWIDTNQAGAPSGTHTDTGNSFNTWTAMPSWGGAGDPTGISLPAGLVATSDGQGTCSGVPL